MKLMSLMNAWISTRDDYGKESGSSQRNGNYIPGEIKAEDSGLSPFSVELSSISMTLRMDSTVLPIQNMERFVDTFAIKII